MEVECPSCGKMLKVAGLFFKTNKKGGELRADGQVYPTMVVCHYCDTVVIPHPQERQSDGKPEGSITG